MNGAKRWYRIKICIAICHVLIIYLSKKKKNILVSKERSKCQVYSLSSLHSIYRFALVHHIFFQFDMRIGNLLWNFCINFLSSVRSSVVVDWGLICYLIILVAKKGSTAQHPARSCQEIRDFGDSIGDVEYWIDTKNKRILLGSTVTWKLMEVSRAWMTYQRKEFSAFVAYTSQWRLRILK